jgi:predicted SAM-dependent methyltransferase
MKIKVHLGCGPHKLEGWINIDINRDYKPDLAADLCMHLPFRSNSVDFIHSEDVIDEFELSDAMALFRESFRILKDDGKMRVLTPDLKEFASRYLNKDKDLIDLWHKEVGIPLRTGTHGELFNLGLRLLGHRFLYDDETLVCVLTECGFEPRKVDYNRSKEAELGGLDVRSPANAISLYYDCYKKPETKTEYARESSSQGSRLRGILKKRILKW